MSKRAPPRTADAQPPASRRTHVNRELLIFGSVLLTVLVGVATVASLLDVREQVERDLRGLLATTVEQKRKAFERLLAQMHADAERVASAIEPASGAALNRPASTPRRTDWFAGGTEKLLKEFADRHHYTTIAVSDWEGRLWVAVGTELPPGLTSRVHVTARAGRLELIEPHPLHGTIEFGVLVPWFVRGGSAAGNIYLGRSAPESLNPILRDLPFPGRTGEILLVTPATRPETGVISLLRAHTGSPLRLRAPSLRSGLANIPDRYQPLLERGPDNNETPGVAYTAPIADTPWLLLMKVDEAEAYAGFRPSAWKTGTITVLLLTLIHLACYRSVRTRFQATKRPRL